jgi:WD40 repeat protein
VYSAAFSSDGKSIVSTSYDDTVRVWNASTGEQVHELKGHTGDVNSAAFSSDGKSIVSASYDKTVRVWNASTGEQVHELKGHTGDVMSAAFSSDGKSIVSASRDETVRVRNASTGEQVRVYKDAEGAEAEAQHRSIVGNASVRSVDKFIVLTENALAASSSAGTASDGEAAILLRHTRLTGSLCNAVAWLCCDDTPLFESLNEQMNASM